MPRGNLTPTRQLGQAAIILILLLIFGVSAVIYTALNSSRIAIENDKATANALALAKDALIGYATAQNSGGTFRPGELPCPDRDNNGADDDSGSTCNTVQTRIGRLPWKTLGLPDLRDGSGERLWYAVSNVFKNATQTGILNSDTAGDYTVNSTIAGTPATTEVIAVIFAPGAVVGSQNRDASLTAACATTGTTILRTLCADNYLEGGNSSGTNVFTTGLATTTFNDKLLLLTKDNFFPAVEKRVMQELADTMRSYYATNQYYPTPAAFPGSVSTSDTYRGYLPTTTCGPVVAPTYPNWFTANNWQQYVVYAVAPRCTPQVSTGLVWLGSTSVCAIGGCLGPIFGLYACVLPNTINGGALNCNNTTDGSPAGSYLTVNGTGSVEALLMSGSYKLGTQPRPCNSPSDCLEDAENIDTTDNYTYVKPTRSSTNNDSYLQIRP